MVDNGIMAQVSGDDLGTAGRALPPAGPDSPAFAKVDYVSVRHGPIVVTFRLHKHTRRKHWTWFWTPCHVELATGKVEE